MRQQGFSTLQGAALGLLVTALALYVAAQLILAIWQVLAAMAAVAVLVGLLRVWWLRAPKW